MSMKEVQGALAETMKRWQKIETASVASTYGIMDQTKNPLIRLVMEIIQRDSQMHHQVQAFILGTLEDQPLTLTPEELGGVWDAIEKHIQIEKQMVGFVKETLGVLKGKHMVTQEYLLNYLLEDEKKHDLLLETLGKVKAGMYPYGA